MTFIYHSMFTSSFWLTKASDWNIWRSPYEQHFQAKCGQATLLKMWKHFWQYIHVVQQHGLGWTTGRCITSDKWFLSKNKWCQMSVRNVRPVFCSGSITEAKNITSASATIHHFIVTKNTTIKLTCHLIVYTQNTPLAQLTNREN